MPNSVPRGGLRRIIISERPLLPMSGLPVLMTRLGSSALRSSLRSRNPADLLRFLLWAYYEVGSSLHLCGDEVGWTALHAATRSGASTDVLRALLRVRGPEALVARTGGSGLTPLHVACDRPRAPRRATTTAESGTTTCIGGFGLDDDERLALFLLARHPAAASSVSDSGDTPLHVACARGLSPLVIRCLLHADPGAAVRANRRGRSPLLIAAGMWPSGRRRGTGGGGGVGGGERIAGGSLPSPREESEEDDELDYAWTVIRMLLLAGTPGRGSGPRYLWDDERFLLHSAIGLGLPVDVVRFALRTFPGQVRQRRDSDGRLPLAVAAAAEAAPDTRPSGAARGELVAELLRLHPGAAKIPDRDGRLPLHLAVTSAGDDATWSDDGVVGRIFRAAPGALAARDPVTRLFPFMLAAAVDDRGGGGGGSSTAAEAGDVGESRPPKGRDVQQQYEPTFSVVERLLGSLALVFGADATSHDSWDVVFGDDCGDKRPKRGPERSSGGGPQVVAGDVDEKAAEELSRLSLVYSLLRHNPSLVRK